MTNNDILANVMSLMLNNEIIGRSNCSIKPISKVVKSVLQILKTNGYITEIEEVKDGKGDLINLKLSGMINKCGVIKPRFNVNLKNYEKYEKRYLPAKDMGIIIVSTPMGIMTHNEAKQKNIGGRLIAYCY